MAYVGWFLSKSCILKNYDLASQSTLLKNTSTVAG